MCKKYPHKINSYGDNSMEVFMNSFIISWLFMLAIVMITVLLALVIITCISAYICKKYVDEIIEDNYNKNDSEVSYD